MRGCVYVRANSQKMIQADAEGDAACICANSKNKNTGGIMIRLWVFSP